jgi:mono/diheme cytochrome c family protein
MARPDAGIDGATILVIARLRRGRGRERGLPGKRSAIMKRVLIAVAGLTLMSAPVLFAQDAAQVAAGKTAYTTQKCSTCHQIAGAGNKMFPLDSVGKKLTAADLKKWLTDPASMEAKLPKKPPILMSTWLKTHKLSDADVTALVAYLQTLK